MLFKIFNIKGKTPTTEQKQRRTQKVHLVSSKALPSYFRFCPTTNLIKDDGFEYAETQQRLTNISQDTKRLLPVIDNIKKAFEKEFHKNIPTSLSKKETRKLCDIITQNLYNSYGPYDERFILAENKKDAHHPLTYSEKKLINDRHPPQYPLKDIPKTQFACFETSVLTSYLLRKLTNIDPEILFFEGQSKTSEESKRTEHAIVIIPDLNLAIETTEPDTPAVIQKHDFKNELIKTGKTHIDFDDVSYKIPAIPLLAHFKDNIILTFKNAISELQNKKNT